MILKNCAFLVTQNPKRQVLEGFDVKIEEGKITEISRKIEGCGEEAIDCSKKIVLPSFINLHTHLAMGLLRGHEDDRDLQSWLNEIWKAEAKMGDREYYAGSKFACLEMIKSGTSAFLDMYFGEKNTGIAAKEAGLRAFLGEGVFDFFDPKKTDPMFSNLEEFIKQCQKIRGALVTPVVAAHSGYTCSKELLLGAKDVAKKHGLLYTMHLSETRKEVYDTKKKPECAPSSTSTASGLSTRSS
ncbi:MAG: amidohydrolase family protein [Candidatus Aenigmatarchaeota archaeon]